MATLQELKDKWITDYIPSEADYSELFDFIVNLCPVKSFTDSFELGNFTTEAIGPTTDKAVVVIAPAPGEGKVNILGRVYIAAKVTGAYSITSVEAGPNLIIFDIYAGETIISTEVLDMQALVFSPRVIEFDINYEDRIGNFENEPISIRITGQGIDQSQDDSGRLELKYNALYTQAEAFPFILSSGDGDGIIIQAGGI